MSTSLPLTVAVILASLAWAPAPAWSQDSHRDESGKGERNAPAANRPGNAPAQRGAAVPGAPGRSQPGHAAGQRPGGGGQTAGQRPGGGGAQVAAGPRSGGGGRPTGGRRAAGDFRGRGDPRQWNTQDRARWQGGHWHEDWHDGRYGWWWEVAGFWYFYDQPVYPFPLIVSPVVDLLPPAPVVMAPPPPPPPAPVPLAAQAQYWYYCDNPPGYYPYVPTCSVAWRQVPAQTR